MSIARNPGNVRTLPQLEELPRTADGGFDQQSVAEAFDAFRRNAMQLSAELRVVKAAGGRMPAVATPAAAAPAAIGGHEARMSAMRIIRAAAEFADAIEREAQRTAATQLERIGDRDKILRDAQTEAMDIVSKARREAEEILSRARRDADGMSANLQGEIDETLDWARAQATSILSRVQEVARQLLRATTLGPGRVDEVADAIVRATVADSGPPPTLIAPLYQSLESARENAAGRPVPPEPERQAPLSEPDDTTW